MGDPTTLERLLPWLRLRVARLRSTTTSRSFPTCVEVVALGRNDDIDGDLSALVHARLDPAPAAPDRGLRVDLLCRLLFAAPGPCVVVVTRPDYHDVCTEDDLAWSGSAVAAAGVSAVDLAGVVMLSRWGWLDLLSGRRRDWKRLRIR